MNLSELPRVKLQELTEDQISWMKMLYIEENRGIAEIARMARIKYKVYIRDVYVTQLKKKLAWPDMPIVPNKRRQNKEK